MKDSPIEDFLDELVEHLALQPRALRRALREVEDHLQESASRHRLTGMGDHEAEVAAVRRFGSPAALASQLNSACNGSWTVPAVGMSIAAFIALGFFVVGLSGLLITLFGQRFGYRYVVDAVQLGDYAPTRCEDFLSFHPEAADCSNAAMLHHYDEMRSFRYDALILGVAGLRRPHGDTTTGTAPAVAAGHLEAVHLGAVRRDVRCRRNRIWHSRCDAGRPVWF